MWKNGKEGDTEWRRIMEGTEGSGRGETIEAEEKTEPRKGGMRQAREGERWDRKERRAGSGRNVVGKTEWEETK